MCGCFWRTPTYFFLQSYKVVYKWILWCYNVSGGIYLSVESLDMAIRVFLATSTEDDDTLVCRCGEKVKPNEQYVHWSISGIDKEFVECYRHTNPTKLNLALSAFESFGFQEQLVGNGIYRFNRVNLRKKIQNPATPSYIHLGEILTLYEDPLRSRALKLIEEHRHKNSWMKEKAEAEIIEETLVDDGGIRRGLRVIGKDRHCNECGVSEADMIAKNPRYTLCRGVCVVCYRKLYRKKPEKKEIENG